MPAGHRESAEYGGKCDYVPDDHQHCSSFLVGFEANVCAACIGKGDDGRGNAFDVGGRAGFLSKSMLRKKNRQALLGACRWEQPVCWLGRRRCVRYDKADMET
jgi:hypothetical protein